MTSRFGLGGILLAALALPASAIAQAPERQPYGTVKVGDQLKQTIGTVMQLQNGDRACYIVLKDARGKEFTEPAGFDFCGWNIIGKRVTLTYRMEEIMAMSCEGSRFCTKKDKVPLIVDIKVNR